MGDNAFDDDISKAVDANAPGKNGYITTHCSSFSIVNGGLDSIKEKLCQYSHNNNKKHKRKQSRNGIQNSVALLHIGDISKKYKRMAPANVPSCHK